MTSASDGKTSGLLWPNQRPHAAAAVLFAAGAAGGFSFLRSAFPDSWLPLATATMLATMLWAGRGLVRSPAWWHRCAGWLCQIAVAAMYSLWLYLAVVFGRLLGWTITPATAAFIALVALATMWTWRPRRPGSLRIPLALPLGLWIPTLFMGWRAEESLVRCDDALAIRPPVEVLALTNQRIRNCRPGEIVSAGRFPRTIWEDHERQRLVFTTQGSPSPDDLQGAFCEVGSSGTPGARCVGPADGKSQGMARIPDKPILLGMQYGIRSPSGERGSVTFEIDLSGPLRIVGEHWSKELTGEGFFEPRNSTLFMFSDEMNGVFPVRIPSFEPLPKIEIDYFTPGEIRYDPARGEGVACARNHGVAIKGEPFTARDLATAGHSPLARLSMTWGCDWDPNARTVYTAIPNLGLLAKINYDSGEVLDRWFVGFGLRSVAYDEQRKRVYLGDFLRGDIVAFDEPSGRVTDRWFVGRFTRWVQLTHDRRALLATSNLGILRIAID